MVVIHAAAEAQVASTRRPSAIETAAVEVLSGVTPQKLRALDTSFSRRVAAALASESSEGQRAQVGIAALPADAADEWVQSLTAKKKPTMGEWFKQLVEEIDEEYAAQEKEYSKHRSSSREEEEPHYAADSPYIDADHHDSSSSGGHSYEQYGRKKGGDKEEGEDKPSFWIFEEKHHQEEDYSDSKPPRYSESPEYESEHNSKPEYTPTHDDSYYNKHDKKQYSREGADHDKQYSREHEQYGPGPEPESPYRRQYEEEQYKRKPEQYGQEHEEQYGPEHPHKESEDVCVQEVARSNCVISDSAVTYTSSLGCCHAPYGERYYAEDKYPGEPDYPSYAAMMIARRNSAEAQQAVLHATARNSKPAGSSDRSSSSSIRPSSTHSILTPSKTMTSAPRMPVRASSAVRGLSAHASPTVRARTSYASPHVFYPTGGKAECAWSLAYHDAVVVDEHTKQIGIASATCHFNGSMSHCGSPLCEGMTITISADVYSTYAVSKYAPSLTASDPSCRALYDRRLGKNALGLGGSGSAKFLPTGSAVDRPAGSPSVTDSMSRGSSGNHQSSSSRSVGDMLTRGSAPAGAGSSGSFGQMLNPVGGSRPSSGSSVSDMLGRSKQQQQPLGTTQPPTAAAAPAPRSLNDFIGGSKPQMPHGSGASGIRSHMGGSGSGSSDVRSHIGSSIGGSGSSGIRSHMGSSGSKLPHDIYQRHRAGHGIESDPAQQPATQLQPAVPQEPTPKQAKGDAPAAATQPAAAPVAAVPATPAAPQPTPEAKAPEAAKPVQPAPAAATPAPQQQPAATEQKAADAKEPLPAAPQPAWAAKVPEPAQTVPAWFAAVPEPRAGGPTQVRVQQSASAAAAPSDTILPLGAGTTPTAKAADTWGAKVPEPSATSVPAWFAAVPEPQKKPAAAKQQLLERAATVRTSSTNGPFMSYAEEQQHPHGSAGGYRAAEEEEHYKPSYKDDKPSYDKDEDKAPYKPAYAEEPRRGPGGYPEEEEHDSKPYYDGPGAAYAPRYGDKPEQKPYYDGPAAAGPHYGGHPEEETPYYLRKQQQKPYSDDADSIIDYIEADVGLYGGEAIVIAGVVTSVKGLPHGKGMPHYTKGMVEHVAAFNGVSLSKRAYEALPYDTPHVKAGAYKVVFFEDDYADRYIP